MKRKHTALLLLLALCLPLLAACHGKISRDTFTIPGELDESRPITITFWAKNDTNQTQTAIYKQAILDFEALYPSITVSMRLYTDYSKIYNDVITNISTNTTPNVCITYPDHIATYLTGDNVVVPLDALMADPRYGLGGSEVRFDSPTQAQIVPQFLKECVIGGVHYALPYMRSTEALYINRDFVEKLGYEVPDVVTWDFIWEVSEKAMAKGADDTFLLNGQKTMIPFIYKSTDNMMISMLRQLEAPYSDDQGHVLIFSDTTRELLEEIYGHAKSRAFSTFGVSGYPGNFLNAGQCVFAIDSTAGATWMGTDAPLMDIPEERVVPFETVVRPIPQFNPDQPRMISQGPSVCVFSREDDQEVLASWLFTQYLLTNEVQTAYAGTEGYVPVTLKAQESEEYREYLSLKGQDNKEHYRVKIEASELLLAHPDHTFVTPVFNGSASLRQAAGEMIESTVKAARRKKEMNDAFITGLYADMNSLYRLDQIGGGDGGLSGTTRTLLISLAAAWLLIGLYKIREKVKTKKKQRN